MRILFVSHSFPPRDRPLANVGGMQRVAQELGDALGRTTDIHLSNLILRTSWRWTHVRTAAFLLQLLGELPRRVRADRPDVVLFSSLVTGSLGWVQRRRLDQRTSLVAVAHGRDVKLPVGPYQALLPRIFHSLDGVIAVSGATGQACVQRGLDPDRLRVIPNGVSLERFGPPAERKAARRGLFALLMTLGRAVPADAFLICSAGRHVERKGFHWFVHEVMARLPSNVHYLLAGHGPWSREISRAARARGLEARVHLLGTIPDESLLRLYRGSDLFLMPNLAVEGDMEGFGVVLLEAGLAGLPVVAADLEGIRDAVHEPDNGWLMPARDMDAWVAAIRKLYGDEDERVRRGQQAARYVEQHFGWDVIVQRYLDALRALLERRREPAEPSLTLVPRS